MEDATHGGDHPVHEPVADPGVVSHRIEDARTNGTTLVTATRLVVGTPRAAMACQERDFCSRKYHIG